jgi:apolipoprotein N-acyltransferase
VRPRWLGPRLAALAAGALWGACFAKLQPPLLPFVALAPLFLFLERDDAGWQGFAHGFGAWAVGLWWIAPTLAVYGDLPWYLALAGLALLAAILALYSAAFALAARRFWRRGGWTAWAAPPAIWVLLEWLRERLLTGFPWNQAAYAWTDFPGALALAAWIGAAGVSWVGLLPPLGVALSVRRRSMAPAAVAVLLALLAFALGDRFAAPRPARIAQPRPVRIVQPNTPDRPLYDAAESAKDYLRLLRMSSEACAPGALLVWPESAAWPAAWEEDPNLRADVAKLLDRGCALLLNSPRAAGERVFNSVYLLSEGSEPAVADKRHLVPFGEYVPLGRALPWLGKLARNAGDFSAAESIRLLPWRGESLAPAVCYEVVFASEVAAAVRAGATAIVTVTNDGWYGDTAAPWQHFRAARFRAAESHRWLLRAAITGVSGVIGPDGAVVGQIGVGESGVLYATFEGRHDRTLFVRAPWLVPVLALVLVAAAAGDERRRRRRAGRASA